MPFDDEFGEHVVEAGVVVAVGSLAVFAAGLVHHGEAIIAVVHLGEPHQEIAGGLLGLVELAGTDEVGSGVGRHGQVVRISALGAEGSRRDGGFHLTRVKTPPSQRFLGRKVYLAVMVVLIEFMREGATAARMR